MDWATLLAGVSPITLKGTVHRLVESQEQIATRQLVSHLEQQTILEDLLEASKPPLREQSQGLHYLFFTPFRYPPLKHGSRFGSRQEPSLFYGSLAAETVLAEAAYYRFVFWYGMAQPPARPIKTQHTLFGALYHTEYGLRLQQPPFGPYRALLMHRSNYQATQKLGREMRRLSIGAFEYSSARATDGINVALLSPAAFASHQPLYQDSVLCELNADTVSYLLPYSATFVKHALAEYLDNGQLPQPA